MFRMFELAQQRGFPNNGPEGLPFNFWVECWLPADLDEAYDRPIGDPLPVPDRPVSLAEEYAGLAAIYDAHWRGSEKIAPWGVSTCGDKPVPWFDIIARLVQTPSEHVAMLELIGVADDERIASDRRSRQKAIDQEGLKKLRGRLKELDADKARFQAEGSTVELAETESEIAQVETQIKAAVGYQGKIPAK